MESLGGSGDRTSQNLLDSFFIKEDQKLIEKLRDMRKLAETKEELAKVSGIKNDAVLSRLVEMNVRPEALASLSLIPLVEVAWADGAIDENEKKAVLAATERMGFGTPGADYEIVRQWLNHRPDPAMLEAWSHYINGLCEKLSPEEKKSLKDEIVGHARSVAEASGGFLGLGNKISKAEDDMLKKLEAPFEKC
jgi:hypothetical protein